MDNQGHKEFIKEIRRKISVIADMYRVAGWDVYEDGSKEYYNKIAEYNKKNFKKYKRPDMMIYHNDRLYGIIEVKDDLDTVTNYEIRIKEMLKLKNLFDLFILTDGKLVSVFIKGERFIETGRPITPDEVDTFIKMKAIREGFLFEDERTNTESIFLQNVRENINALSGYVLSDSNIDYIIDKAKFMETLRTNPNIINSSPRQIASSIVFSAALDVM